MGLDTLDTKSTLQEKFLIELGDEKVAGNVLIACRRTGIPRATAYHWKANDPSFAERWLRTVIEAQATFADEAEYALRSLVLKGNPTATMFALKKLKPAKWGDKNSDIESRKTETKGAYKVSPRFAKVLREMYPDGKIVSTL